MKKIYPAMRLAQIPTTEFNWMDRRGVSKRTMLRLATVPDAEARRRLLLESFPHGCEDIHKRVAAWKDARRTTPDGRSSSNRIKGEKRPRTRQKSDAVNIAVDAIRTELPVLLETIGTLGDRLGREHRRIFTRASLLAAAARPYLNDRDAEELFGELLFARHRLSAKHSCAQLIIREYVEEICLRVLPQLTGKNLPCSIALEGGAA